ncbi:maleylpyruvate isomerase family mycothiol-dependent enzyme [Gordonia sp. NPDC003425]
MEPEQWLAAIKSESEILASTSVGDLAIAVPSCPGWTVHDLLGHVGAVHRWAADRVAGTRLYRGYDGIPVPGPDAVIDWYVEGRDQLVSTLGSHDPDDRASTFVGERTVAFWYRRQAHEVAVHRWDLESATQPPEPTPIPAALATDAIDEWFEVFAQRSIARGPGVPPELAGRSMHLHATDVDDGEWSVDITADGFEWRREHSKADVALRGSAADLLLTVWHRIPRDDVERIGDHFVAARVLDLVHVT